MVVATSGVLQQVTTPLALAALVLLLGAPLLREILKRRGRPNADTRAIVRNGFVLGLVLGTFAFLSYVFSEFNHREVRISGTVRDESGAGLASARVDIDGRDGGTTDAQGRFAFTIAASRSAKRYQAVIFHEGYLPAKVEIDGDRPQPLSVELKRASVRLDGVITLPATMVVRHNLGVPSLELAISLSNPLPTALALTGIGVTLVSPAGESIPMLMEGVSVAPGRFDPPSPAWTLPPSGDAQITYYYFNGNPQFAQLQERVWRELAPQQAQLAAPNPQASLISAELVADLRSYMESQFVWTPGNWELRVHAQAPRHPLQSRARFRLSETAVGRMRAIANYYPAAIGVAPNWRFWSSADVAPMTTVALESIP